MIVLSFLLVVIAAVTLLVGLFQDTLTWIWASIASCVLAMIALGVGVLQRRSGGRGEPSEEPSSSYGPGAISSLIPGDEDEETSEDEQQPAPGEVTVVPKRTVSDAKGEMSRAEVEEAADQAVAEAEAKTAAAREAAEAEANEKPAKKAASKRTAKRSTAKKASKKKAGKKKAAKKTSKKATSETKGKAARERLDEIKGLGPAKQKALLAEFGSLEGIRDADLEDLRNVKGIGETTAAAIKAQLS